MNKDQVSEEELKIRLDLTEETKSLGIDLSSENAKAVFEDLVFFRLNGRTKYDEHL